MLALGAIRIADLRQVDLVRHVSIADAVFVAFCSLFLQRREVHVVAIPRALDGDGYAVVEVSAGIVDFKVSNAGLDDACFYGEGVEVRGYSNTWAMVSLGPLYY